MLSYWVCHIKYNRIDVRMKREYFFIILAVVSTIPALTTRLAGIEVYPPLGILIFGAGVVGAAFILSWAAEVAQKDISQNLAVVFFALVAILPEYAVDLYFAWTAAKDPAYTHYALANMTGANRLLIGLGWPVVVFLYLLAHRKRGILLEKRRSIDIFWMTACTLYGFSIVAKGTLTLIDALILFSLFTIYVVQSARAGIVEPELIGPPAEIAKLPRPLRRTTTAVLFLFSAVAILGVAEPFAESLVASGSIIGIDEFFLVQWLAPLASETPEFVAVSLLVLKQYPSIALGVLISSKVNQWSLLVGAVPVVYIIGNLVLHGNFPWGIELDTRQMGEVLLTGAQGFFAVSMLLNYHFRVREAFLLGFFFFGDVVTTITLEQTGHPNFISAFHYALSGLYILLGLGYFLSSWSFLPGLVKHTWQRASSR